MARSFAAEDFHLLPIHQLAGRSGMRAGLLLGRRTSALAGGESQRLTLGATLAGRQRSSSRHRSAVLRTVHSGSLYSRESGPLTTQLICPCETPGKTFSAACSVPSISSPPTITTRLIPEGGICPAWKGRTDNPGAEVNNLDRYFRYSC